MCTTLHIVENLIFVNYLKMGIEGTTLASFCTNLLVLITNVYLTSTTKSLKKANKVSTLENYIVNWNAVRKIDS